ncbi:MAG: hypothetical protein KGL73_06420 [Burkholderiales bacterium]|nr:hypothetical protein [Burkholderiales bacterium]
MATDIEYALMAGRVYQSTRGMINWLPDLQSLVWTEFFLQQESSGFEVVSFPEGQRNRHFFCWHGFKCGLVGQRGRFLRRHLGSTQTGGGLLPPSQNCQQKWLRKSEQRYKWKLRA